VVVPEALEQARDAARRGDWEAAYERFRAVEMAALGPADLEAAADAAWWTVRLEESMAVRRRAYSAAVTAQDDRRAARTSWFLSFDHLFKGETTVAAGWLRRAERHLDGLPECVEHGYLALARAGGARERGDLARAESLASDALAMGRRAAAPDLVAMALQELGRIMVALGRTDEGAAHLDDAMCSVVAGELSPLFTGWVYCTVLQACLEMADLRRAAEWTEAALAWCEGLADRSPYHGLCRVHRAEVTALRGAWEDAETQALRASEELLEMWPATAAAAFYAVGEIRRRRGLLAGAEEAFARAGELGLDPQPGLALVRLAQGRAGEAAAALRRAAAAAGTRMHRADLLAARAEVALAVGDVDEARDAGAALDALAGGGDGGVLEAIAAMTRAALRLADDDVEAALRDAGRAWTVWQELRLPHEAARARLLLGRATLQAGDRDRARIELEAAHAAFARLGADRDARAAAALLGRPAPAPGGLSDREVEVLRLVASGRTNREVAAAMSLSEHTVSRHLQNIFAKLRVSSRTAATAFAFEHDLV
jgi:ATP/maltotriose-dependent transcriptional regulator MalT